MQSQAQVPGELQPWFVIGVSPCIVLEHIFGSGWVLKNGHKLDIWSHKHHLHLSHILPLVGDTGTPEGGLLLDLIRVHFYIFLFLCGSVLHGHIFGVCFN